MNSAAIYEAATTPAGVQAYASRSLDFLQAIEKTVGFLRENGAVLRTLSNGIEAELAKLKRIEPANATPLDPEGRVCELLDQCTALLERVHGNNSRRCEAARSDQRLRDDDGVVDAYEDFLAAVDEHHTLIHELKEWIRTYDSLLEQPSGTTYKDVDDLFRAMGVAME